MSNQAENKAGRVKVARLPQEFCVWSVFYQSRPSGKWAPWASGDDKEKAIKYCRYLVSGINQSPALMTHYDGDPEALYFDAENPNGIPVEWDDEKTADMQAKLKAEREYADKLEKMIDKIREIALDNNDWHITGFIDRETKNVPQPYRGEDKLE